MSDDFYCDEVLSGRTLVVEVVSTEHVIAFHHTRPMWRTHIVVTPRMHIDSLLTLTADDILWREILDVIHRVTATVNAQEGGCHVVTNVGRYQDSKHLHWHIYGGERIPS